ncbi:MAG: AAA family ATPase [Clostridiales bacterium GWE2_32_10]|nr:MAG: AAA family ATPase [Clostridiales bacterium GWE2_32_10]HBY19659.1 AAA family ATPase [Clostridiales bacterium]
MKKKNIINLIKYYSEKNDTGFRSEAYEIAKDFDTSGDYQLSEYIMALLSNANTFIPQMSEGDESFFRRIEQSQEPLPLPEAIKEDVIGIVNAVGHNAGINKFLFQGAPGTGKTETVKQIARILDRELYMVDFDVIIDCKLGQTSKNIAALFSEINKFAHPEKIIILFDEIDAIALDRTNSNDLREMGRATSSVLKGMDNLNEQIVLIATTNLFDSFDKALIRRFDSTIDFNRYSREDLLEVAEMLLTGYLNKFKFAGKNVRLFRKILEQMKVIPYPGGLKNIIRTSIAFSKLGDEYDYLRRLYHAVIGEDKTDLKVLQDKGFTVREIEMLTGVSKSQVARELKE